jgi:hypothetical protein
LPPLRLWTFVPVTGQILSRIVVVENKEKGDDADEASDKKKKKKASESTPDKKSGVPEVPAVKKPKGSVVTPGKGSKGDEDNDAADDDDEEEDDGDDEAGAEGEDLDSELQKIEAMTASGKKRARKGTPTKKAKAKVAKKPKA